MSQVGYARVSTRDQNPGSQEAALREAGCERVFVDRGESSRIADRPEWVACLDYLREGDTLVVTRLDRLGRNVRETINTIAELGDRGMNVRVLEPKLDTSDPMNKVVVTIMSALAEWERDLLIARTREGVAHARSEGRVAGPKPKLTTEQIRLVRKAVADGESVSALARTFGVSRQTVYRALEKSTRD